MTDMTTTDPIDFLYHMMQLLDDRDLHGWYALCDDAISYVLTNHENLQRGNAVALINDDHQRLAGRILLMERFWHAEKPPTRTTHMISNARAAPNKDGTVSIQSYLLVSAIRRDRQTMLTGRCTDVLKPHDASWKLAQRRVVLDKDMLSGGQITFIV